MYMYRYEYKWIALQPGFPQRPPSFSVLQFQWLYGQVEKNFFWHSKPSGHGRSMRVMPLSGGWKYLQELSLNIHLSPF